MTVPEDSDYTLCSPATAKCHWLRAVAAGPSENHRGLPTADHESSHVYQESGAHRIRRLEFPAINLAPHCFRAT